MSNYEEEQSEDGELAQSPAGHEYSLSSDGDGEPPDALTIKPPPPRAAEGSRDRRHRHQARRERSARRDKKRAYRERDPAGDVRMKRDDMTKYPENDIYYTKEIYREREYVRDREYPREKEPYRPRVHLRDKEYKEKEVYREPEMYREKDNYRDKESYRSKDVYREKEHHKEKETFRDKDPYREKEVYFVRDKERMPKLEGERLKNSYRHSEMDKKASLREEARMRHIEDESRVKDVRYNEKENRDKLSGDKELEDLRSRLLSKRQTKEQQQDVSRKRDDRMDFSPERQPERRDKFKKSERESVSKKREERMEFSPEREMSRVSSRLPELDESQLERRERLLKTEREMSHRKKASREALAARREKLKENAAKRAQMTTSPVQRKRHRHAHLPSPQTPSDVVTVSDASDMDTKEKGSDVTNNSEEGEGTGSSTDSSSRSNTEDSDTEEEEEEEEEEENADREEDRDSDERPKNSYKNNKIESEGRITEPPSPHNIDSSPLSTHSVTPKHSISRSPSRSRSSSPPLVEENGTVPEPVPEEPVKTPPPTPPPDERLNLPVYYPGIQGCRSVEEFQCLNRIEEGTYGVVYRARDKTTDEIVALKRLKMEKEKEGFPITSLREINTLLKGQHPNIVTVREIVVGSNMDKIFIVMDYVEHDLKGLMETMRERKQVFIPGEVKCLMQQLLRAVDHLHDNWILHRDLKTSNLLLSHKGILKVGDFGLAREYGSPLKSYTPVVVTLWYRAPELLLGAKQYSTHIDIWSVGCIFAEFITMHALFPGKSDVDQLNKIFKELGTPNEMVWPGWSQLSGSKAAWADQPGGGLRTKVGTQLTDTGLQLLQGLLKYDPQRRITAHDALAHAYFKEKPMAIDPAMFPTWPAKSEGGRRHQHSPKPPSGGDQYKLLRDEDQATSGFHMGQPAPVTGPFLPPVTTGFSLKF